MKRIQSIPIMTTSQQAASDMAKHQNPVATASHVPTASSYDNNASFYSISEMNTDVVITNELYNNIADRTKLFMRDYRVTNSQLGWCRMCVCVCVKERVISFELLRVYL
jgi:hypothetical protein